MTSKSAFHDFKWRVKVLVGLAMLGGFVGGAIFVEYMAGWQTVDIPHLFKILPILYEMAERQLFGSVGVGAFLFFWFGVGFFWKPWITTNQPEVSNNEVKRPW